MEWALTGTESKRYLGNSGTASQPVGQLLGQEGDLRLELLESPALQDQAFRLRHQLFAETLHWVPAHPSGREFDGYDRTTEMLGIVDGQGRVLGTARMHPYDTPFMLEQEFAVMLGGAAIPCKGRSTAEVTRFGLEPGARTRMVDTPHGRFDMFCLLIKAVYRWCMARGVNTLLAEVDTRFWRLVRVAGFPWEALAEPQVMPDGVVAVAIRIDWDHFREVNRLRRPGLLAWFDEGLDPLPALAFEFRAVPAGPASGPWPQPAAGSPRPVSSGCSEGGN